MPDQLITQTEHDDGTIVEIKLNRPDKRNALNQDMLDELTVVIGKVSIRPEVRVIILGGKGKTFSAGMDLKAVSTQPEKMGQLLMTLSRLLRDIRRAPMPFIARVQGAAMGGGCGLMTLCDFAFTHGDSKLGYPEVSLGICPAVVAPWLVSKIGAGKARQILLNGAILTGDEAYEFGLVSHVVDLDDLHSSVMNYARNLVKGGQNAMAVTKHWLNELDGSFNDEMLDKGAVISAEIVQNDEAQGRLAKMFGNK